MLLELKTKYFIFIHHVTPLALNIPSSTACLLKPEQFIICEIGINYRTDGRAGGLTSHTEYTPVGLEMTIFGLDRILKLSHFKWLLYNTVLQCYDTLFSYRVM